MLSLILEILKRRTKYQSETDEFTNPPELKFIVYDHILSKYKNHQIAVRQYENLVVSLKRLKSKDFRIELAKRFLINDNQTYSEEILNTFIDVANSLGIDN